MESELRAACHQYLVHRKGYYARAAPTTKAKGAAWRVEVEWECNWISPYENADGSPRTFATREEAERALEHVGDVYIRSWRDNLRVVEW